jgi:hypothetical protein
VIDKTMEARQEPKSTATEMTVADIQRPAYRYLDRQRCGVNPWLQEGMQGPFGGSFAAPALVQVFRYEPSKSQEWHLLLCRPSSDI